MRTPRRFRSSAPLEPLTVPSEALQPSEFDVNQAWLVARANRKPILAGGAALAVYVLQDAASMYIFGNVFAPWDGGCPLQSDVDSLFQRAWAQKREWPTTLLVPNEDVSSKAFVQAARRAGVSVQLVQQAALAVYTEDVQSSFEEHLSGGSGSAA